MSFGQNGIFWLSNHFKTI